MFVVHESSGIEYQPPRQLAVQLAKRRRTVLVYPPTRWLNFTNLGLSKRIYRESLSLTLYSPYELPRRNHLSLVTDLLNVSRWRRELRSLCPAQEPVYVIFDRPTHHRRVGLLREKVSAYYAHCDYTVDIIGRSNPRMVAEENALLRNVDVAFAASPLLMERFSRHVKNTVHLSCGYDADLFDGTRAHDDFDVTHIPKPRILLSGFISGRVDFEGLLRTVKARPDWHFVLLGAMSPDLESELLASGRSPDLLTRLRQERNVHYLGVFPLLAVPPVIAACDVGLVPYCLSAFTMASSPIKTFEYLAMGKPVVSTAAPESVAVSDEIFLAEEGDSYVHAIERALSVSADQDRIRQRIESVRNHSMQARAETVLRALGCPA